MKSHKPVGHICKTCTAKRFASGIYKEFSPLNNNKQLKKVGKRLKETLD